MYYEGGHNVANLKVAVNVELPDSLVDLPNKFRKKLPGALRRIAMEGKSFWKSEAGRKLKSSRIAYQKGIDFKIVDELSFYLELSGFIPYAVEAGVKSFDMKPGLLANPSKRKNLHKRKRWPTLKSATRYKIVPINDKGYIRMTKPKKFRTVTDVSPGWIHPGLEGRNLVEAVVDQLDRYIIPKHMEKLMEEVFRGP